MTFWTKLAAAAAHTTNTVLTGYNKACEWDERVCNAVERGERKTTGGRTWDEWCSGTGASMKDAYHDVRSGTTTPVPTPTTTLLAQVQVEAPKVAPTTPKVGIVAKVKRVLTKAPKVEEYSKEEFVLILTKKGY